MSEDAQLAEDPADLLRVLANIKAAKQALEQQFEQVQERLIGMFPKTDTLVADLGDGQKVRGTVVRAERVVLDEEAILSDLPVAKRNKVVKQVLDKGLLEAQIAIGAIDAEFVADRSEVKVNKPYVKISGDIPTTPLGLGEVTTKSSTGKEKAAVKRVKARKKAQS